MTQATTDPLILAAEEADAEAAAAEAEAVAAQASATAARARARAARLRREAGTSGEPPGSGAGAEKPGAAVPVAGTSTEFADDTAPAAEPDEDAAPVVAAGTDSERAGSGAEPEHTESGADPGRPAADTEPETSGAHSGDSEDAVPVGERPAKPDETRRARVFRRWPRPVFRLPPGRALGRALAGMVVVAALVVSGFSIWNHHRIGVEQARADEYLAAARQGVLALTSMDSGRAADDVRRVLDNSTGAFRTDFQTRSEDFTKVVEQSKVATQGEITASAVESMTDESAVVLVSAVSRITNSAGAQQEPRVWRLSVTVTRDGPDLKMSKVEFVP
ncbi:hypothetical protein AB0H42_16735 [Nocardia sp. NPDC050799]|uniref:hypothetical protein n=1 Tax=Nocardia sp. NPDC050799 TaxID=3154842 RepID=UPI003400E066